MPYWCDWKIVARNVTNPVAFMVNPWLSWAQAVSFDGAAATRAAQEFRDDLRRGMDFVARRAGLKPGAQVTVTPLEDIAPQPPGHSGLRIACATPQIRATYLQALARALIPEQMPHEAARPKAPVVALGVRVLRPD